MKKKMSKFYGLFIGQNASTGTSNNQTGGMSFYGNVLRFDSIKTRAYYIETHQFDANEVIIVPGGRQTMRNYCLGMSLHTFVEYVNYLDVITMEDLTRF